MAFPGNCSGPSTGPSSGSGPGPGPATAGHASGCLPATTATTADQSAVHCYVPATAAVTTVATTTTDFAGCTSAADAADVTAHDVITTCDQSKH